MNHRSGRATTAAAVIGISTTARRSPEHHITVGVVVRAHGVRGALLVRVDVSMRQVLRPGIEIELAKAGRSSTHEIVAAADHSRLVRVVVTDIYTREQADTLRNAEILVDRDDLPELGDDQYYDFELIGARVVTADGEDIGALVEILPTGANDVYVVEGESGEVLVPAIAAAVLSIDRDAGRVVVDAAALEYSRSSRSST